MRKYSDEKIREFANQLGDWIERDAILHIPDDAPIERDDSGAWVGCKILVPLPWKPPHD